MSPRTRDAAKHMVELLWAVSPPSAVDYVAALWRHVDPDGPRFHTHRLMAEAAENRLVALFRTDFLDTDGAQI